MLSKLGRRLADQPVVWIVNWLNRLGVKPNALTYTGFLLTAVTALLLGTGMFRWGAVMLLVAAFFDMLDGSLARLTNQSSTFGAFIDSTLDRYSESVTFLALAFFYSQSTASRTELVLIFVIIIGSLMVSYTRARAEGLNIECKVGVLQRPERILLLAAGLLTGWMLPTLWIMAVLTNFSVLQRIYEVYWRTNQSQSSVAGTTIVPPKDNHPVQG